MAFFLDLTRMAQFSNGELAGSSLKIEVFGMHDNGFRVYRFTTIIPYPFPVSLSSFTLKPFLFT